MSDENNGNASSAEQTIPKSRFDEVLAETRALREQTQFQQQTLSRLIEQQQRANRPAEQESPELLQLKQDNPAAYAQLRRQQRELKELRAANFDTAERTARMEFLQNNGAVGKKRLAEVEKILDNERRVKGNFHVDREGIFNWLEGQDRLTREREAASKPAAQTTPAETVQTEETEYVPSSNPRLATTVVGGTAPARKVEKTREEVIEEIGDVVF